MVFGIEDSLISTLGVVTGMASGTGSQSTIVLAGIVLVTVEALSMAAGEMISSQTEIEVDGLNDPHRPIVNGLVMGVAYVLAGVIPVGPYAMFAPSTALPVSILATALAIFLLGVWKNSLVYRSRRSALMSGLELLTITLAVSLIGYLIGAIFGVY